MALQAEISTATGGVAGLLGLLPKEVFAGRMARARERMGAAGIDVLFATPGTHFYYLTGITAFRSERLIALALPRDGEPLVVCPAFEESNVRGNSGVEDVRPWGETDDPYALFDGVLSRSGSGVIGFEPTTWFETSDRLGARFPHYSRANADTVLAPLRMAKQPEELARMRAAIRLTQEKIARGWLNLRPGVTELEFAHPMGWDWVLSQFGATSAIPHAHGGDVQLRSEMAVLTDCGNNDGGYCSDITRSTWFGKPPDEYRRVWNIVREAQEAGFQAAKPGVPCEAVDAAARAVIVAAGYGEFFTHRTGHGLGLDVHEAPYMVAGNRLELEPGMTFTIEPGIYLPGKFGVRIEDDFVITASGCEALSTRVDTLEPL